MTRGIPQLQQEFGQWAVRNFPDDTRVTVTLGISEEVGELCRAVLKQAQGIRGTYEEWESEIHKEVGDVFIKLVHVAEVCGFDLYDAIIARWDQVRQRDWITDRVGHGIPRDGA